MALNDFSVLLFIPATPKVLAEIKKTIYAAFCPLILRLKLSHNAIKNKVYYDLATTTVHCTIFQIRKGSKLTGQKSQA